MEPYYKSDCIFCQISQGKRACHAIWEDSQYMAFLSIYPNTPGITVVIPKHHYDSYLFNQSPEVMTSTLLAAKEVAALLVEKFETVGRTALVFEGYGINHLHAKLFPLHGTKGEWRVIPATLTTTYTTYPGYISTHDVAQVPDEALSTLAAWLRKK